MSVSLASKTLLSVLLLFVVLTARTRADEFIGPLAGWADAQANYHAGGKGLTDDTAALQQAINDLGTPGHTSVLYLPAGTYCISSTLSIPGKTGIAILGQDPASTTIKWTGPAGGTMVQATDSWYSRYGRLTWDGGGANGSGKAGTIWNDASSPNGFVTANSHEDEVFKNAAYGLRSTGARGDAETAVQRCQFLGLSTAGISVESFNALDWFVWYCTFKNCAKGVANDAASGAAGGFQIYFSYFEASTVSDISIGNTSYFGIRYNYSVGSQQFFTASWQGDNSAPITLQKNVVLDCRSTPVDISNVGTVLLLDNTFRYSGSPTIKVGVSDGQDDTVSVGNTYAAASPISVSGRLRTLDDKTVAPGSITLAAPTMPGTLPNNHRHIFEVSGTGTGADIQAAINSAVAQYNGQRPVVHIGHGDHAVSQTIVVPASADVQIVGDGFQHTSQLTWTGTGIGPVLWICGPSRATLRDLHLVGSVDPAGKHAADVLTVDVGDLPGDRVYADQLNCNGAYSQSSLLDTGLDRTLVEVHQLYHSVQGTDPSSQATSVVVSGGPVLAAGGAWGGGRCNIFCGVTGGSPFDYSVLNHAHLLIQDLWHDDNVNFAAQPGTLLNLNGSGTFTYVGGLAAVKPNTSVPAINMDGFQGTATFLNVITAAYQSSAPFAEVVQSSIGSAGNVLFLGVDHTDNTAFVNYSAQAQVGFLNCKYAVSGKGCLQYAEQGRSDAAFLRQMLAQERTEAPSAWPLASVPAGGSDVRLYRVTCEHGLTTNVLIQPIPLTTPGASYALKAQVNGLYVCADNSGRNPLVANRTAPGPWETFQVVPASAGGSMIGLKALVNGQYVCADSAGSSPLIANRANLDAWETFGVLDLGNNNVALQAAANGALVSADLTTNPAGLLLAERAASAGPGAGETFHVEPH